MDRLDFSQETESKRRVNFTKRKFLALPAAKQHKILSQILKNQWASPSQKDLSLYNEIQEWMNSAPLASLDPEAVSCRYHSHLKLSKQRVGEHNLLPSVRKLDREWPMHKPFDIAVYLDNLRSAHNVGSILRTVEAFSLGEVIFSQNTPFVDHPQVQKTSMGAWRFVKCSRNESINSFLKPLIVLETAEDAIPLNQFRFPEKFTLVLGNEEYGISKELLESADFVLEIPLRGRKNSLNVANAFAIAAAEIAKQLQPINQD